MTVPALSDENDHSHTQSKGPSRSGADRTAKGLGQAQDPATDGRTGARHPYMYGHLGMT